MSNLSITNVGKHFGQVRVLNDINIQITVGEFVALVGPSGCGKSTLLRMIAGLEGISSGEIEIGGKVVNALPPRARDVAMVFQNYALYPQKTVAQNIAFPLRIAGLPKSEIAQKVKNTAEILGLNALLDRYPRQLSGGQRQRVAMGRAIVRDPRVFLFDEPLSNLDAKLRVQMRSEIKALHQRLKVTTVYVTHDQVEAMTMADRIVVMKEGRVCQMGAPLDVYDRPADTFVAGFIGSPAMTMFEGTLNGQSARLADGSDITIGDAGSTSQGQRIVVGIRPDAFQIAEAGLATKVEVVEPTGGETFVVAQVAGQSATLLFRDRVSLKPGEHLHVCASPDSVHVFDAGTGQRLN